MNGQQNLPVSNVSPISLSLEVDLLNALVSQLQGLFNGGSVCGHS
jgi:hypothetical protein